MAIITISHQKKLKMIDDCCDLEAVFNMQHSRHLWGAGKLWLLSSDSHCSPSLQFKKSFRLLVSFQYNYPHSTYINLTQDDINDAADNYEKIKDIPGVPKVSLEKKEECKLQINRLSWKNQC